ncbi:hypothetical protein NMY22_g19858 [Coprinellus aureogranulatus]|nr:hypothetical protein NMY22_g19858 [Coprinellus aureogranulatus]
MQLFSVTLRSDIATLEIESFDAINDAKAKIQGKGGVLPRQQRLVCTGNSGKQVGCPGQPGVASPTRGMHISVKVTYKANVLVLVRLCRPTSSALSPLASDSKAGSLSDYGILNESTLCLVLCHQEACRFSSRLSLPRPSTLKSSSQAQLAAPMPLSGQKWRLTGAHLGWHALEDGHTLLAIIFVNVPTGTAGLSAESGLRHSSLRQDRDPEQTGIQDKDGARPGQQHCIEDGLLCPSPAVRKSRLCAWCYASGDLQSLIEALTVKIITFEVDCGVLSTAPRPPSIVETAVSLDRPRRRQAYRKLFPTQGICYALPFSWLG